MLLTQNQQAIGFLLYEDEHYNRMSIDWNITWSKHILNIQLLIFYYLTSGNQMSRRNNTDLYDIYNLIVIALIEISNDI